MSTHPDLKKSGFIIMDAVNTADTADTTDSANTADSVDSVNTADTADTADSVNSVDKNSIDVDRDVNHPTDTAVPNAAVPNAAVPKTTTAMKDEIDTTAITIEATTPAQHLKSIDETFINPRDPKSPIVKKTDDIMEAIGNLYELQTAYGCAYEILTATTLIHKDPRTFQKVVATTFHVIKDLESIMRFMRHTGGEHKFNDEPLCVLQSSMDRLTKTMKIIFRNTPIGGAETASLSNCRAVCMRTERRVLQIIDCGLYDAASAMEVKKYLDKLGQWTHIAANVLRRR